MSKPLPTRKQGLSSTRNVVFRRRILLLAAFAIVFALVIAGIINSVRIPSASPEGGETLVVRVIKVIDGDTIEIRFANGVSDRLRLTAVDTPELSKAACDREHDLAVQAKRHVTDRIGGKKVEIVLQADRDPFNRLLGDVRTPDGADLGEELLAVGLAVPWPNEFTWCR